MQARKELLVGLRNDISSFLGHHDFLFLVSGSEALGCAVLASDIDISVVVPHITKEERAVNGIALCNAMRDLNKYTSINYNHAADPPLLSGRSNSGIDFDIALGYARQAWNGISPSHINHQDPQEFTKVDVGNKRVNVLWGPYCAGIYQEYLRERGITADAFAQAIVYTRTWCRVRGLDNHRLGGLRPTFIAILVMLALPRLPPHALRPQLNHRVVVWAVCATFLDLTARPELNHITPCGRSAGALVVEIANVQCAKIKGPLIFIPHPGFHPSMYHRPKKFIAAIDAADATGNNNTAHGICHGTKEYIRHRMAGDMQSLTQGKDIFAHRLDLSLPISLVPIPTESRILTAALRVYYRVEMTAEARTGFMHDLLCAAKRAMDVADRKLGYLAQCYHHMAASHVMTPWTGDAPWPLNCAEETPNMAFTFIIG